MKQSLIALVIFSAAGVIACTSSDTNGDSPVLATVQNSILTVDDAINEIPPSVLEQDSSAAIQSFTEQWVNSQVMIKEAERIGLANAPEIQQKLDRLRGQLLQEALKDYILNEHEDELKVTREEAQNYYQAHKEKFILEERYVRVRYLTTRTRTEADNAKRDLMRGISWEEVATQYSVNSEVQLRHSNQFWPISMAVKDNPPLHQLLNVIGITEISPIRLYQGQYHFVQLMEERPEGEHPDLDWLIPQITEWLKLEKARRITNSYVRNLYLESEAGNDLTQASVTEMEQFIKNKSN